MPCAAMTSTEREQSPSALTTLVLSPVEPKGSFVKIDKYVLLTVKG